ncbi:hypothetical protein [Pseudomonas sp. Bout1]|uniref:PA4575 family protein n=1 Tax=Pseudomonas sp. Bout1 TaxID=3048600 RepID=UPI003A598F53
MSRNLCLTRQCLGLVTRIECSIRPLAGDTGMWTLLFAAGMTGEQPSTIKSQGPFHGPFVAQTILDSIVDSLTLHGYELADDPQIWCVHLQAHLRQLLRGWGVVFYGLGAGAASGLSSFTSNPYCTVSRPVRW